MRLHPRPCPLPRSLVRPGGLNYGEMMVRGLVVKSRMTRTAEMTLEKIYKKDRFPSDDVLESIWELHKIPRAEAVAWFRARRG